MTKLLMTPLCFAAVALCVVGCTTSAGSPRDDEEEVGSRSPLLGPAPRATVDVGEFPEEIEEQGQPTFQEAEEDDSTEAYREPGLKDDMLALQEALEKAIAEYSVPGNYAMAVTDLQTGETVSVNGQVRHLSGCVINSFVLLQAIIDVAKDRYPLDSVEYLIAATTWSSNASTARQLYRIVGDGDVLEGLRKTATLANDTLGLDGVILNHAPGFPDEGLGVARDNWVTAEAMNLALVALWHGDLFDDDLRSLLLDHLESVMPGLNYLTAMVPEGAVAHKNGFFPDDRGWVDNDVGIVRLSRGEREFAYAVSFLSDGVERKYGGVELAQQLVALAYQTMAERYP